MRFKLYEGRRTVPHTKAEMGISTQTDTQVDTVLDDIKPKGLAKFEITPDTQISVAFEWGRGMEPKCSYGPAKRYRTFAKFDGNKFMINDNNGYLETLTRKYQVSSRIPFNTNLTSHECLGDAGDTFCAIVIGLSALTYPGVKRLAICYEGEIVDDSTIYIDKLTIEMNGHIFEGEFGIHVYEDSVEETFQLPSDGILSDWYYAREFDLLLENFLNRFLNEDAIKFIQGELEGVVD